MRIPRLHPSRKARTEKPGFNLKFELDDWLMGVGEIAERCAPAVLDYGIRTGWAGLYEVTPDCNQIIDRPAEVEGLLIATGYSGHGFLMGPATGEIIRDLYHGRVPHYDISGFTLDRFSNNTTGVPRPTSCESRLPVKSAGNMMKTPADKAFTRLSTGRN